MPPATDWSLRRPFPRPSYIAFPVLSLIPSSLLKFSQWTSSTDLGEGLDLTLERGGSLFGQESQRSGSWFFEFPVRHGGVVEVVEVFDVQAIALIRRRRRRAQAAAASTSIQRAANRFDSAPPWACPSDLRKNGGGLSVIQRNQNINADAVGRPSTASRPSITAHGSQGPGMHPRVRSYWSLHLHRSSLSMSSLPHSYSSLLEAVWVHYMIVWTEIKKGSQYPSLVRHLPLTSSPASSLFYQGNQKPFLTDSSEISSASQIVLTAPSPDWKSCHAFGHNGHLKCLSATLIQHHPGCHPLQAGQETTDVQSTLTTRRTVTSIPSSSITNHRQSRAGKGCLSTHQPVRSISSQVRRKRVQP